MNKLKHWQRETVRCSLKSSEKASKWTLSLIKKKTKKGFVPCRVPMQRVRAARRSSGFIIISAVVLIFWHQRGCESVSESECS